MLELASWKNADFAPNMLADAPGPVIVLKGVRVWAGSWKNAEFAPNMWADVPGPVIVLEGV